MRLGPRHGWPYNAPLPGLLDASQIHALTDFAAANAGCWVIAAAELLGPPPANRRRPDRSGRGPLAWDDHPVLIPATDEDGLLGTVVVEDPTDRLLPREPPLRDLRLLVDLAASVVARSLRDRDLLHSVEDPDPIRPLSSADSRFG